jgi:hypothetical protein
MRMLDGSRGLQTLVEIDVQRKLAETNVRLKWAEIHVQRRQVGSYVKLR